jgi:hypothetical protein
VFAFDELAQEELAALLESLSEGDRVRLERMLDDRADRTRGAIAARLVGARERAGELAHDLDVAAREAGITE